MSVEIREIIIQAILEQDQDPEAAARAERFLLENGDFDMDFVKKKKKKPSSKDPLSKEEQKSEEEDVNKEEEEGDDEDEEGEDEFLDERESIINECLDRVRDLLEKQMFR